MDNQIPRIRMFAGPNGSGKSTIKSVIPKELLGIYINPDEIEKEIRERDFLDIKAFGIHATSEEILSFFSSSSLLAKANLLESVHLLRFDNGKLDFLKVEMNSYFASVASDFIRQKLLQNKVSFTFETVMSSADKVELLKNARLLGYRTYLYYVATQDPIINISRVKNRVRFGGHAVPEDKIVSRYYRSLELLSDALSNTDRAYIFDNSGHSHIWLAEITDGKKLDLKTDKVPAWFKGAVLDKFSKDGMW